MKKAFIVLGIVLIGALGWFYFNRGGDEPSQPVVTEPQDFPAPFDDSTATAELAKYESDFGSLAFDYPSNWNVTEAADNSADFQLLTVESPLDINEFYFCLDLTLLGSGSEESFTISDAEVLAVDELGNDRKSVIYNVDGLDNLHWGVTEDAVKVGDKTFTSEVSNPSGERLQLFGRFDCRSTDNLELTKDEFQNSRWLHEAKTIVNSLEF